jgi:hypothetical protein
MRNKSEIMEMKSLMKEESSELKSKIRDLEYRNEILIGDREANEEKVKQRISEIETEKQDFIKEQEEKNRQEIERKNSETEEEQSKLTQQIFELQNEGITRTDEFLRSGVEMDRVKDDLATSLEKEVKLNNEND